MRITLKPGFPATAAMLLASIAATLAMGWREKYGFGAHCGFPFPWCEWADLDPDLSSPGEICWWSLLGDAAIWLAVIVVLGGLVEIICSKLSRTRNSSQEP